MAASPETLVDDGDGLPGSTPTFRVLSFNCLRRGYGFDGKYWVPPEVRAWEGHRRPLLAKTLAEFGADIMCLQEVESPEEDLFLAAPESDWLRDGNFEWRRGGRGKQDAHTRPLTLFRADRFRLVWERVGSRVMLVCLEDVKDPLRRRLYVANAHLQGGWNQGKVRAEQVASAFKHIRLHHQRMNASAAGGGRDGKDEETAPASPPPETSGGGDKSSLESTQPSVIFCGDFNCSAGQSLGEANNRALFSHFDSSDVSVNGGCSFHSIHAFNHGKGTGLPYTFKWGTLDDASYSLIDQFYATHDLGFARVEPSCPPGQADKLSHGEGLPNKWNCSDHLPLKAVVEWRG